MEDVIFALLVILAGALFCFFGYLAFRIIIPIWGAVVGFSLGAGHPGPVLALVPEHRVRRPGRGALHEVREEPVQCGPGMAWPGQAPASQRHRAHAEIPAVLLTRTSPATFDAPKRLWVHASMLMDSSMP